jgi:hypothetical protein
MNYVLLLLLATLYGCATSKLDVDTNIPSVLFFSPETSGPPLSGKISFLAGSSHQVSLARSTQSATVFSSNPTAVVVHTNTELGASWTAGLAASLGIFKRLDITLEDRVDAPMRAGLQWQVIGPEYKKTGFKFSLLSSVGYYKDKETAQKNSWGDQSEKLSNVTSETKDRTWSAGFSSGLRLHEAILFFVSGNYQEDDLISNLVIVGGNSYNLSNLTKTTTGVCGLELNKSFKDLDMFIHAEVGLSQVVDRAELKELRRVWGIAMGGHF